MNELIEYQLPAPPQTGTYVRLETVGNPDFNQYAPISEPRWQECKTVEGASKICREYIEFWGAGGGNWVGGDVYQRGERIAHIGYNGRVWRPGDDLFPEALPFAPVVQHYDLYPGMSHREHATVLAGLRAWQSRMEGRAYSLAELTEIATNCDTVEPLNISEIDELCERINQ